MTLVRRQLIAKIGVVSAGIVLAAFFLLFAALYWTFRTSNYVVENVPGILDSDEAIVSAAQTALILHGIDAEHYQLEPANGVSRLGLGRAVTHWAPRGAGTYGRYAVEIKQFGHNAHCTVSRLK